jgi:hypothetical protein
LFGRQAEVDEHIDFADSDSYSAHVKSIESKGVTYHLEDNDLHCGYNCPNSKNKK